MYRVETTVSCYACNTVELSEEITIHVYDSHYKQFAHTHTDSSLIYTIIVYRYYSLQILCLQQNLVCVWRVNLMYIFYSE